MGHVIAGAAIGRDLAFTGPMCSTFGAPMTLSRRSLPGTSRLECVQRPGLLHGGSHEIRSLLKDADVFFANKRPGYLERYGLDAEELCGRKPGLIHARVVLHGDKGPWKNRPGFDEVGAAVRGCSPSKGRPPSLNRRRLFPL